MIPCHCGGPSWDECCGPLLSGTALAATAERLMRSRYSAFVVGDGDYLWRTWHPRTRPDSVTATGAAWTGLRIHDVVDGGEADTVGVVEFEALYSGGSLRERSRFEKRGGRWFYLDGDIED